MFAGAPGVLGEEYAAAGWEPRDLDVLELLR